MVQEVLVKTKENQAMEAPGTSLSATNAGAATLGPQVNMSRIRGQGGNGNPNF
jgi:hypothetical protein